MPRSNAPLVRVFALLVLALPIAAQEDAAGTAPRCTPVMQLFFASISDPYLLDGQRVEPGRDRSVLASHLRDDNRHLRRIATMAYGSERLRDAIARGRELADEPGSGIAEFQGVVLAAAARAFGGDRSDLRQVVTALQGDRGAIGFDLEAVGKGLTAGICVSLARADTAAAVQGAQQEVLPAAAGPLTPGDLEFDCVAIDGEAWLVLGLLGDVALRDCTIVCNYRSDAAAVMATLARQQSGAAGWLQPVAAGAGRRIPPVSGLAAAAAVATVDGGSIVFVPVWKPGSTVHLRLASAAAVANAPGQGTLSLWSDAAELLDEPLPIAECCRRLGGTPRVDDAGSAAAPPAVPLPPASTTGDGVPAAPSQPVPAATPPPAPIEFAADVAQANELRDGTQALDARDLDRTRAVLGGVIKALQADGAATDATARRVLVLAQLRLAEAMYLQGLASARQSKSDEAAAKLLRNAERELPIIADDFATAREGSSVAAATLRRRALIHAVLYAGYRELLQAKPNVRAYRNLRDRHRRAAESAFADLSDRFAEATMPDGRRILEVVRGECRSLLAN